MDSSSSSHEPSHLSSSEVGSEPLGRHPLVAEARPELRRMHDALRHRLFGGPPPTLGRFRLLERLGHGGMGVVYAAFDPGLQRRVAIKQLKAGADVASAQLVREARALARLSHPNVVAIHEVSDLDGEVFLVMELLGGGTLRQWLGKARRSWQEVVDLLVDAGEGLAAAHAIGLVHRDFKPENVLLGDDGRPRVVDFGLTRAIERKPTQLDEERHDARERTSDCGGTPAYMAPEHRRGRPSTLSDQYGFCVVLHEALLGRRPDPDDRGRASTGPPAVTGRIPRAVLSVMRRGLAPDPRDRFADMPALLAALRRARRRRPWGLAGLAVAGLGVGVALALPSPATVTEPPAEPRPCAELRGLVRSVDAMRLDAAELDARLHRYLAQASAEVDAVCQDGEPLDARAPGVLACVRRRVLMVQALEELWTDGTIALAPAIDVARQLPDPRRCAKPAQLASEPDPPADPEQAAAERDLRDRLARAQVLRVAGAHAPADSMLDALHAQAQARGSLVARAEIELERARSWSSQGRTADALAGLRAAIVTAERADHSRCRAWAQIELGGELGLREGDVEAALEELERAEATVQRIGGPEGLPAKLLEVRGAVAIAAHRFDEAAALLRQAVALTEDELGPHAFALVGPVNLLGAALAQAGAHDRARAQLERARALVQEHYGAEHPLMGRVLNNLGQATFDGGDPQAALAHMQRALELDERNLGPEHPSIPIALDNLARVLLALGRLDEAEARAGRALAIGERLHGSDGPELRFCLATLARLAAARGRHDEAVALLQRAHRSITTAWGERAVQHLDVAQDAIDVLAAAGRDDALAETRAHTRALLREHRVAPSPALAAALASTEP